MTVPDGEVDTLLEGDDEREDETEPEPVAQCEGVALTEFVDELVNDTVRVALTVEHWQLDGDSVLVALAEADTETEGEIEFVTLCVGVDEPVRDTDAHPDDVADVVKVAGTLFVASMVLVCEFDVVDDCETEPEREDDAQPDGDFSPDIEPVKLGLGETEGETDRDRDGDVDGVPVVVNLMLAETVVVVDGVPESDGDPDEVLHEDAELERLAVTDTVRVTDADAESDGECDGVPDTVVVAELQRLTELVVEAVYVAVTHAVTLDEPETDVLELYVADTDDVVDGE